MKKNNIKMLLFIFNVIIILLLLLAVNTIKYYMPTKENNAVKIEYTEKYENSYYKDLTVNNENNESKSYYIALTFKSISKELMSDNFNIILSKSIDNGITYQEEQRTSTKYLTQSKIANTIYLYVNLLENEKGLYKINFWEANKNNINKELYIDYEIKVIDINKNNKNSENNTKCLNLYEEPVIKDGLIPVKILNDGSLKTINKNEEWYNYCNKEWANAVLVKESKRSKYINKENTLINKEDVLAYFVWIPRYSYKIWTDEFDTDKYGKEKEIEIKFISKEKKEQGTKINEWYTHPAFTFGNMELSGLWVGKFEITGNISYPTILPNEKPIMNYNLGNYFKASLLLSGGTIINNEIVYNGSTYYGLNKDINSHLIKNSEWSAITYLSHSRYGINTKIRINNYNNENNLTGCGAFEGNESSSVTCDIIYGNSDEYPQSTTGNISGIFDLTGGAGEYVMAYLNGENNLSGISNEWFLKENNKKYYDFYPKNIFNANYNENIAKCTLETCMGHALYETYNWYITVHNFVDNNYNFIKRGCGNYSDSMASEFCFGYATGEKGGGTSSRIVLITET